MIHQATRRIQAGRGRGGGSGLIVSGTGLTMRDIAESESRRETERRELRLCGNGRVKRAFQGIVGGDGRLCRRCLRKNSGIESESRLPRQALVGNGRGVEGGLGASVTVERRGLDVSNSHDMDESSFDMLGRDLRL